MHKTILFVLLIATKALGQGPVLIWDDFHAPAYPRNAQIAHIMGPVTLELTLGANNTVSIKTSTGHPLLVPAAEETIRTSKLRCANCNDGATTFAVFFDFAVANHDCDEAGKHPPSTVNLDSSTHVSFMAEPVCTYDPRAVTIRQYRKVRSLQCLYLWRCKKVLESSSTSSED